jgi:hypothetical protein
MKRGGPGLRRGSRGILRWYPAKRRFVRNSIKGGMRRGGFSGGPRDSEGFAPAMTNLFYLSLLYFVSLCVV